jgi:hypothetical protein
MRTVRSGGITIGKAAALLALVAVAGVDDAREAAAQVQNAGQARCIVTLNKCASKLANAQARQIASCIKAATKGALPASELAGCVAEPGRRVLAKLHSTIARDQKLCADPPDFGYAGATAANAAVVGELLRLGGDVFGDDLGAAVLARDVDAAGARCQAALANDVMRLAARIVAEFVACKARGVRLGQIASASDLAGRCLGAVDADDSGRIGKSVDRLIESFIKRCGRLDDPMAPFPGSCRGEPEFPACVRERARCRSCLALDATDALGVDCDEFDDGERDGSCPVDECALDSTNDCDANAVCATTPSSHTCTCNPGYSGDGLTCFDVDECALGVCPVYSLCVNTEGSFYCACTGGFCGEAPTCGDCNECVGEGTGNDCDVHALCINTVGSFVCQCEPGWHGDGRECVDDDECQGEGGGNDCAPGTICVNLPGSYQCDGPPPS